MRLREGGGKQKQKTRGARGPRASRRLRVEVQKGNLGESWGILGNLKDGLPARGEKAQGPLNRRTGEGWVAQAGGDYTDALAKGNGVLLLSSIGGREVLA